MDYKIIRAESQGLLVVKTAGLMNAGDFIAMAEDLLEYTEFFPNGNVIFDHTALDFRGVPAGDLQQIRGFHMRNEAKIGNGKSAVLVKAGLSEQWHKLWSIGEKIQTENKVEVFENYDDAVDWVMEKEITGE